MTDSTTSLRICALCEAACGLTIVHEPGRVLAVRGDEADVFSRGYLCPKGASLGEFNDDPDRLDAPLVRRDGEFVEAGWDEAFAEVARGLGAVQAAHGRDAVALYVGNPMVHTLGISLYFAPLREALGTRNVYTSATLDTMPKSVACGLMYGDPLAIPVPDVDRTDLLLILGANPFESNGSLWTAPDIPGRIRKLRKRGGRLVVADPARTRTAAAADRHVRITPGADPYLLAGIIHVLFAEDLVAPVSSDRFDGLDVVRAIAARFPPERVASACGVEPDSIRELARELSTARTAAVYGRLGTSTTRFGTVTSWLIEVVNILTGNLDRPGGTLFGQAPHAVPRPAEPFTTGRWHSRVRGLPEVSGELPTATLADEIATPGPGQVRALIGVAGNLVLAAPNGERLDGVLGDLEFMVSVDPYLNETTRHADVILPPPRPLQSPQYEVVLARRAVRRVARYSPPAWPLEPGRPSEAAMMARLVHIAAGRGPAPPPDAVDDAVIDRALRAAAARPGSPLAAREIGELAARLTGADSVERRIDLMLRLGPAGDLLGSRPGLNLAVLKENPHGVDLGALEPALPGVLLTSNRKVQLAPGKIVADVDRLERRLDAPRPGYQLISRRQLRSLNSWSHNVGSLAGGSTVCRLRIHPTDAAALGVSDEQPVAVRGRHREVVAVAELSEAIRPGVVSLPYGWGHGRPGTRQHKAAEEPGVSINALTDEQEVDPLSGTAVFNGVAVELSPVTA
ncbi:molybdopterin-dependent oxidoreductase [Amycolatopsis sp. NPDC059021]|uniref:molybdopterin-dependent oxidoreductase n=1 Tax=Amycolatopsis sp. NPDC059021 TaxID=3346704 RepID=UPI00366F1ED3